MKYSLGLTIAARVLLTANIEKPVFNAWLMGTKGGADVCTGKIFTEDAGTLWDRTPYGLAEKVQTHFKGIEYFIDAIRENKPVPVPPEEACITQSIIAAIYKSAKTGKEVRIRQA
jgi:predicted dehydrogenase